MQRHRVLIAFGIAWLTALGLSWWVYRSSSAPEKRDTVSIVAAAKDLPIGKRVETADVKLITLDRKDLPKGAFLKAADIVDRAVSVQVTTNEPILAGKIAAKGSGEGLTSLIEPGTRAISVQVNEISGVSGFIQPGTRVDVLFTRVFSNGDAATVTILQNVKVIAYGKQLEAAARVDPRDTSKPTVATLLVTQDEAEKLVLAMQRGRIQLVLRNALDEEVNEDVIPTQSVDLGIEEPRRPVAAVLRPGIRPEPRKVIRIYRGDKLTEQMVE
ncbi:MAG: Flp pilus assembly protein CpaB [Bryobacterales bacterium]|nr:Flp pilus assembly protein CpaB [Bryobacterales bacterium]